LPGAGAGAAVPPACDVAALQLELERLRGAQGQLAEKEKQLAFENRSWRSAKRTTQLKTEQAEREKDDSEMVRAAAGGVAHSLDSEMVRACMRAAGRK
jgi:hypothetical protein